MKKSSLYYVLHLEFADCKTYTPGRTDPALYPDDYWVVKCKDGTYAFADAYKRGRFYINGTLIKNVVAFANVCVL